MQIEDRLVPNEISEQTCGRIASDIRSSLNSVKTTDEGFIINDTLWYFINPQNAVKATVVNSAKFISKKFQKTLNERGWTIEKKIEEQRIDGYIQIETEGGYQIDRGSFKKFIQHYWKENPQIELDKSFNLFFQRYCNRSCFSIPKELPIKYHQYFEPLESRSILRIGLEFETGNIASSFRAFSKLAFLYQENYIDAAIFITSKDKKSTATRIWPVSNRNGSFEELDQRNYRKHLIYPLWEFSFTPDGISTDAAYLSSKGTLYNPQETGKEIDRNGRRYAIYLGEKDREILLATKTLF